MKLPTPGHLTMPMEFIRGRPLSPDELEALREEIEGFDSIEVIDPAVRAIVKRQWPHLLAKLPPEEIDE